MSRKGLYGLLISGVIAGFAWIFIAGHSNIELCLMKHTAGIPCPSCGSTRSVLSLLDGNIYEALLINPIGLLLFPLLILLPLWIAFDLLKKKSSLYDFYRRFEIIIRRKAVAVPAVLLIIANWIWNISKGL